MVCAIIKLTMYKCMVWKGEHMYEQLKKNTVSAQNQLASGKYVRIENPEGKGIKVLFVGNSITFHEPSPQVGWLLTCGMSASAPEKDYVHQVMARIREKTPDASHAICQVSHWEHDYKNGKNVFADFVTAREYDADVIIVRLVDNCPLDGYDGEALKYAYLDLIDYLNPTGKAKVILTTGFWKHPGDEVILQVAEEKGWPCAYLGDLGELDEMKALGRFEHHGVAIHPGDLGMKTIAQRICQKLEM